MDRLNINTVTTAKGPAMQQAIGMYLIEIIHNGVPDTKWGFLIREHITGKELTLQLFANAIHIVSRLNAQFDTVECYFDEPFITTAFQKWIDDWQSNEWKTIKGKEVAHKETWKTVCTMIEGMTKRFIYMGDCSSYHDWMMNQCELKEMELKRKALADKSVEEVKNRLGC